MYSVQDITSISIRFRGQTAGSQRQGDIFCLYFGLRIPWPFVRAVYPRPSGGCTVQYRASSLQSPGIDAGTESVGAVLTRIPRSGPEGETDRGARGSNRRADELIVDDENG